MNHLFKTAFMVCVIAIQAVTSEAHDPSPVPQACINRMPRVDVWRLSPAMRRRIAHEIHVYITDRHVNHHAMMDPRAHRDGRMFLRMHRDMIRKLEQHLNRRNLPLPTWYPGTPIPFEFAAVERDNSGRQRPLLRNLNPRVPMPAFLWPQNVRQFRTETALGNAILPWHNQVHTRIGGAMSETRFAAATPVFWLWHAYIDNIYAYRQSI